MTATVLMVQGTASSVGKSVLVTALCRILLQDGLRVAPFKAQNMSNNSYVTRDGGEIGRAQVNQAEAAGIEPRTDMNPILLKPESDHRSQVVVDGRPYQTVRSGEFLQIKRSLWPHVVRALDRLRDSFDAVVIEGAGSPAEINLRDGDIVNMRVARQARAPVLLVGDIDRGGVFAHLVGTLELLQPEERSCVRAFVINKFRGDTALLVPGLEMLEQRTGVPVAGVIPYLHDVGLAEEDAVALDARLDTAPGVLDVAVIHLPHISNFDDFDPLQREPAVSLRYVRSVSGLGNPDLVILPGTKATIADLVWLRRTGLADSIVRAVGAGSAIAAICGGYQMLGRGILDRLSVESDLPETAGLGLIEAETEFEPAKATHQAQATVMGGTGLLAGASGMAITGYEIHMGRTRCQEPPAFRVERRSDAPSDVADGALGGDGWVLGTYLHGLFANDNLRATMLANLAARKGASMPARSALLTKDSAYDRLASQVRAALDMDLVRQLLQESVAHPASRIG